MLTETQKAPEPSNRFIDKMLHLDEGMSDEVANWILRIEAPEELHARIEYLAGRSNEGELTEAERREYESYVHLGDVVGILQSRARVALGR